MVVVSIISLLVVFLVVGFSGGSRTAGLRATRALFVQLTEACDRFKAVYGFYPPDQAGRQLPETAFNPAGDATVKLNVLQAVGAEDTTAFANRADLESNECLAFCLQLERRGGPFLTLKQKQLANLDADSVPLYLDKNGDFRYQAGEDLGRQQPVLEVLDAWGTPIRYVSPTGRDQTELRQLKSPGAVEVYSAGPNRKFGWAPGNPVSLDEDDLASWQPAVE
jgi:type II secretory pathway pseudopilin PulG